MVRGMSASAEARPPARVLPVIVLAQLLGVSPWFAVNAVMPDLQAAYGWPPQSVGSLTAALTLGFIGAFAFAEFVARRARQVQPRPSPF